MPSRIASTPREAVVIDKRRAMTEPRKRRIHEARNGLCGDCGLPVEMTGPGVRYDHRQILEIKGSDADDDIWPLHFACDAKKTAADLSRIAKTRRQAKLSLDVPREPSAMKSGKRKWPKRKFSTRRQISVDRVRE